MYLKSSCHTLFYLVNVYCVFMPTILVSGSNQITGTNFEITNVARMKIQCSKYMSKLHVSNGVDNSLACKYTYMSKKREEVKPVTEIRRALGG